MSRSTPPPVGPRSAARPDRGPSPVSPIGLLVCVVSTMVALPILFSARASGDEAGEEVAVVADAGSESTLGSLAVEVEEDELFEAGPRDDDAEVAIDEAQVDGARTLDAGESTTAVAASPQSLTVDTTAAPTTEAPTTTAPTTEAPATTAPTTTEAPTTTAAPTTEAPTTTAAPTTEAPTTTAPPATEAPATTAPPTTEPPATTEAPAPSEPTAEQWAALRTCESSGNYAAVSSNGLYHGAYQFWQPTWDGVATRAGRGDLVGVVPSAAAPADQDLLALQLWRERGPQPWPVCGRHLPPKP